MYSSGITITFFFFNLLPHSASRCRIQSLAKMGKPRQFSFSLRRLTKAFFLSFFFLSFFSFFRFSFFRFSFQNSMQIFVTDTSFNQSNFVPSMGIVSVGIISLSCQIVLLIATKWRDQRSPCKSQTSLCGPPSTTRSMHECVYFPNKEGFRYNKPQVVWWTIPCLHVSLHITYILVKESKLIPKDYSSTR